MIYIAWLHPVCLFPRSEKSYIVAQLLIYKSPKRAFDLEMHGERVPLSDQGKPGHCMKWERKTSPPRPLQNRERERESQAQHKLALQSLGSSFFFFFKRERERENVQCE
ncbi:hypothetical protein CIPAW_15G153000 [Carya illinoinensis]|uniref:Uncharacterized protein n=1 Tax=Carya illinoinensis TaxID=32201 RepID=A0A8T1NDT7_CARIL|nr:hypothetical protein CIPAW_15G153000 [Carya illinoinensis]